MANKYTGIGSKFQIGDETTYGTLPEMDMTLNYLNESLKLEVKKEDEETLLAGKTINGVNINGYDVSGDFTVNLKPENLSFFKYFLKEEAAPTMVSTGYYKHTLTFYNPTDEQPSFSATIDRKAKVVAYTGLLASSVSIQGDARSPISVKVSVKGQGKEVDGTISETLEDPALESFNAIGGSVSIKGSVINDITSASIEIDESLDDGAPTYGSGLYNNKHQHGRKIAKPTFDCYYNSATSPIREADYKGNTYIANYIEWVSRSEVSAGNPYKIRFTMPKVSINEASPTVSGKDVIKLTISGNATSNASTEPLTVEIWDNVATKY